ncbi:MAG: hypothetical protein CSA86_00655 [Arcobacter sp.]|nr:MAG: hypothetical protein CSA86_00655 [Arcobacter sp.]
MEVKKNLGVKMKELYKQYVINILISLMAIYGSYLYFEGGEIEGEKLVILFTLFIIVVVILCALSLFKKTQESKNLFFENIVLSLFANFFAATLIALFFYIFGIKLPHFDIIIAIILLVLCIILPLIIQYARKKRQEKKQKQGEQE